MKDIVKDRHAVLLEHHLKELRLPTFLREYGKLAAQCADDGVSYPEYLFGLAEMELNDRYDRMVQRRIRAARFPATKSLDTFDFSAIPSVNQALIIQLARCEFVEKHENVIAVGNSGTGKTHIALGLGLAACQRGAGSGLHHRGRPGQPVDGSPGRASTAEYATAIGPSEPADHR